MTIPVPFLEPEQLPALDKWLRSILWDSVLPSSSGAPEAESHEIHRLKARIPLSNGDLKIVQGVRDIFEIRDAPSEPLSSSSEGKIVIIGKRLVGKPFKESLLSTIGT